MRQNGFYLPSSGTSDGLVAHASPRVSVCIPTRNRTALLREAIESCFRQSMRPFEILIGDDSTSGETQEMVAALQTPSDVTLRYRRNERCLGQSRNVNRLLGKVEGTHLVLLHDDDLLCDGAIERLTTAVAEHPGTLCAYGYQTLIAMDGQVLPERTEVWSQRDRRVPAHTGPQTSPLRAALWCQPPSDGYLLDASVARSVRYRDEDEVGHAVDADFMIRLAKTAAPGQFVLVPEAVSKYRLTPNSIARSDAINVRQDLFFQSLVADGDLDEEREARDALLRRIATGAALDAAVAGNRIGSLRILLSPYYREPLFSRWTGYRLTCIVSPGTGRFIRRMLDPR